MSFTQLNSVDIPEIFLLYLTFRLSECCQLPTGSATLASLTPELNPCYILDWAWWTRHISLLLPAIGTRQYRMEQVTVAYWNFCSDRWRCHLWRSLWCVSTFLLL